MKRQIITTSDGSKTIYIPELDENYHSGHGALQEAVHVFIRNGLQALAKNEIAIFEMGFGTGLNAYLSMIEAERTGKRMVYTGIEAFPVELEMAAKMGYPELLDRKLEQEFLQMHRSEWGRPIEILPRFTFTKLHQRIEDHHPHEDHFDIVFYDAFGPRAQGEMWEKNILGKMHTMLKTGGVLVTYCAKGQFRRDLIEIGFTVERLPGPPGKREMIRAVKL